MYSYIIHAAKMADWEGEVSWHGWRHVTRIGLEKASFNVIVRALTRLGDPHVIRLGISRIIYA